MTALRSLLARRAMGVGLLIVYAGALEIGTVDVEKPRKPGRSLQDAEDSTVSSRKSEAEMLINNPTMVCDDCPTIYGFEEIKPQHGGVSIQSGTGFYGVTSWVVVMYKLPECSPDRLCREAEAESKGRFDGRCTSMYHNSIRGMAIEMDLANMATFANATKECVQEIWRDETVSILATQSSPPWGLDRIDQPALPLSNSYTYNSDGTGVHAYIIDTGILLSHHQFHNLDGSPGERVFNTYSGFEDNNATDCHGHGTHVAATVGGLTFGVAKNVSLHAVRVLDCKGNAQYSRVITALDHITKTHLSPAVAVLSLGGEPYNALDLAVQAMVDSGMSVAVAAGNDNRDACLQSPARVSSVITVGATSSSDTMYWSSNFGKCVDLFAPGVNILSAVHSSNTATGYMTGTSMSAPFVAGAAALFLERNPTALPYIVAHALVSSGYTGQVANPKGAPNILLSTNVFAPVKFSPPEFRINDQTADQAFWVSVTLAKSPLAPVDVLIDPASAERGSMTITSLTFDANTWDQPQYFVFEPSEDSPRGESYNLVFTLTSSDDAYNGLETYFQVTDERQKRGEDLSHPLEIRELPFLDSRDTAQYTHIYNYDCSEWGDSGNAPDVVYLYQPKKDIVLDINLCESTYDSKVFVLRNGDQDNVFGCNDDICGYQSRLRIKLLAGDDYFIIIDGYDGDSGRYVLQIREITGLAVEKIPPGEVDETLNPLPELPPLETASDVELLSLALTNCDLRPVFSPAVDSYSCTMPPGRPETSVTYATANMASTVQVINQSLQNGRRRVLEDGDATEVEANDVTASTGGYTQLQLQEGQNRVIITVMSPDLERQRSYEVVVKLMSEARETRLKSLTVKEDGPSGLLSSLLPPFSFDHFEYEAAIAWRTEALWFAVEPLSKNPHVTVAVGGQVLQWRDVGMGGEPGPLSASVPIQSGRSAMEIKVTAADGETTAAYSVSVSRETRQPAGEAVNCEVTAWGPWQPCSRQCGGGVQLRKREVSVYPRNSGLACPALVDERMCNEFACRLDCSVSPWGQWSQCSTRCGDGFQIRTRYVLDFPSGGGGQCPDLTEQRPCEIPPDECFRDADCRLGAWGIWTECSAPCGGGTQTRERAVVSPQLGNGRPCSVTQEVRPCNVHECDSECQVTDWGRWGPCDSACGPGEQHRWRSVVGVPSNGSPAQCPALRESRPCTSPVCLPGQQPYPSDTSQDVVPGSSPPPSYSLDSISDDEGMFRDLPGRIEPPKHRWLIYGFGACSSTCGGGVQTRTVQCARIEGEGWEISDPRACETEGAGPQPSSTRACNVEACEGATSLVSEWQSCSATCGWGARERAVSCKGLLGLLLPRSSCLQEKEEAFEPCATNDCPRSEPYWRLGSWGRCSVHCGGGTASRDATCIDPLLNAETTPERCGPPPSPLERPCNTRPCRVGVWRAGPWGSCSSTCSSKGSMSRDVRCVALDSDGEQPLDDRECLATGAAKPKDTAQCGKVSCGGCGAHSRCSGNGACWDAKLVHSDAEPGHTACACSPGFLGDTCEVPPGCLSGVVDSAGRCCSGAVGRRGQCCTSGAAVDFEGQCCKSGVLDACGVCDGPSIAVDVAGSCCPGPLDAAGLCCPSGHLDECGVCDGDGTTCALVLDLVFVLSPALELSNLLDTGDGRRFLEEEAKAFVAEKLGLRGGGSVSPESGTAKVTEIHVFETGHDFVLNAQVRANSGQHVTLLGGAIPKTSTRQVENNRKPRRSLLQEVHRVPMVPVDEDWLASKQQILSVRMRVTGPLEDDGSPVRASTAISVLSEEVFDTPDDVPDGNSNSILSLAGITYVDRRGICGNGFCEVGERPIEAEAWAESYQFALNLCPTDCPTELRACPAPVGSDVMCGGYGRCLQASGVCDCFIGYGGDDCGDCAPGYLRTPGGQCTPNADTLLAISSSALKVHTGSAGPSPTMIFFISMGAVVISICAVVVGGALTYLRYRLKKAALTQSPAHSKIRTHGCIEHLHDAVDLSHINPMVVQGSAAGNPAGTSLSSTPRAADHHVVSSFAPSKNATESPATPPASPLAAPVEKPPPGCCPATQTHQLSGAKRTRDVQPASHAPQGCFTPCSSPDSQSPPVGDDLNMFSFPSLDIRKDYQPRVLQYNTSPSEIRGSGTANCGTGSAVSRIRSRGSDTGKSSDSEIQDPRPPADEDSPEPSAQLSGGMEAAVPSPSPSPANLE